MAGTDGIDVVLLHQEQIPPGLFHRDGGAGDGVAVVAVHAEELDLLPVDVNDAVFDLPAAQAHLLGDALLRRAQEQRVLGRRFRIPQHRGFHREGHFIAFGGGFRQKSAVRPVQPGRHRRGVFGHQLHTDGRRGQVLRHIGVHKEITDMGRRTLQQVHIPENTAHAQLVLVLQVGAVAPLQHQHRQSVVPFREQLGDVELAGGMGNLAVPGEQAVHPQVEAGVHALKVQVGAQPGRPGRQSEVPAVQSAGVILRHIGRVIGDRVLHVGVVVVIVALGLPTGGHLDLPQVLFIEAQAVLFPGEGLRQAGIIPEPPHTVERDAAGGFPPGLFFVFIGNIIRAHRLAAHVQHGRIFVEFCKAHGFSSSFSRYIHRPLPPVLDNPPAFAYTEKRDPF